MRHKLDHASQEVSTTALLRAYKHQFKRLPNNATIALQRRKKVVPATSKRQAQFARIERGIEV